MIDTRIEIGAMRGCYGSDTRIEVGTIRVCYRSDTGIEIGTIQGALYGRYEDRDTNDTGVL